MKTAVAVAIAAAVLGLAACGGGAPAPAAAPRVTVTASSSPAPAAQACQVAMGAVTGARALTTGAPDMPSLRAAGKLLSRASHTVAHSGAPLFHTLAGSVSADLSEAAVSADEMVLQADLGTANNATYRQQARSLRSWLARITRECAS